MAPCNAHDRSLPGRDFEHSMLGLKRSCPSAQSFLGEHSQSFIVKKPI